MTLTYWIFTFKDEEGEVQVYPRVFKDEWGARYVAQNFEESRLHKAHRTEHEEN